MKTYTKAEANREVHIWLKGVDPVCPCPRCTPDYCADANACRSVKEKIGADPSVEAFAYGFDRTLKLKWGATLYYTNGFVIGTMAPTEELAVVKMALRLATGEDCEITE